VDITALRVQANQENADLGPEPADPHEHAISLEERRGACVLLAGLADWRADLCRKAALDGDVWISPPVAHLLLDATEELPEGRRAALGPDGFRNWRSADRPGLPPTDRGPSRRF
jgi:hypothetical protein